MESIDDKADRWRKHSGMRHHGPGNVDGCRVLKLVELPKNSRRK